MSEIKIETGILIRGGKYLNAQAPFTEDWSHYRCDKAEWSQSYKSVKIRYGTHNYCRTNL
jgi:hypothetical protein